MPLISRSGAVGEHLKSALPCVLAVGGLDPGGGAGVLADARGIERAGAFACASVTLLTVQSTSGLQSVTPVAAREVIAECTHVIEHQSVRALKVGALGSVSNARAVGKLLARYAHLPAIVDTVMLPSRGAVRLLDTRAVEALRRWVIPNAALVTVNAPEAEVLTGARVTNLDEASNAANTLIRLGARGVLVKGGHLRDSQAGDVLVMRRPRAPLPLPQSPQGVTNELGVVEVVLAAPRLPLPPFHGGGCIFASLIAGRLAMRGTGAAAGTEAFSRDVCDAVQWAKKVHHRALTQLCDIGGRQRVLRF